ncbi:hypothetical protein DPM19_18145 [Actinomadura craniellae]|uniref:Phage tail protein n=1 Tax=Actinomadura craniellae TaxID=2231787 RepID=A0A365H3C2_9ACTN|nr:hypothetical protein [Actinomadura craniellae]RAY13600.1 hypothetical protein DPM19_18145 [Actinomadura craniellae]
MALSVGELVAFIRADDRGFRRTLDRSEQHMQQFQRDTNGRLRDMRGRFVAEGEAAGEGYGGGLIGAVRAAISAGLRGAGAVLAPLAALPLKVAAIAATAVAAAPLLAALGAKLLALGQAALAVAPMLLSFAAAGLFVKATLKQIFAEGSAARKALQPIGDAFTAAGKAASEAAARGIRPLAQAFTRVAFPHVRRTMVAIGQATNQVMREFLAWGKSTAGVKALRGILDPISKSVRELAPHVSRLAISFVSMLGRISGVSMAVGSRGLAGALDWLADRLDRITAASVSAGLDKLKSAFQAVSTVVGTLSGWVRTLVDAYRTYTAQFRALADVVSVLAIVFGGPVTAVIAAAGLVIRHFDEVKAAYERIKQGFSSPIAGDFMANVRSAVTEVLPSLKKVFADIKAVVIPALQEIWTKVTTQLIPAFGQFLAAAAPVVSWLVGVFGPMVVAVFRSVMANISGAISIITGILKVFTGILTGDWGKAWDGVKAIAAGAWQIITGIIRIGLSGVMALFKLHIGLIRGVMTRMNEAALDGARAIGRSIMGALRAAWGGIRSAANGIKNTIVGVFRGAGSWLVSAGRAILDGLISGIRGAIGRVRDILSSVTGMIPSWKGPMAVDLKLLEPSGAAIMSGLMDGITGALPALRSTLGQVTDGIAGAVSGPDIAPAGAAGFGRDRQVVDVRVTVDATGGDDHFLRWLRRTIRVEGGGNVQQVLGKG